MNPTKDSANSPCCHLASHMIYYVYFESMWYHWSQVSQTIPLWSHVTVLSQVPHMYLVLSLLGPGLLSISFHCPINNITKYNSNLLGFRWTLTFVAFNVFMHWDNFVYISWSIVCHVVIWLFWEFFIGMFNTVVVLWTSGCTDTWLGAFPNDIHVYLGVCLDQCKSRGTQFVGSSHMIIIITFWAIYFTYYWFCDN